MTDFIIQNVPAGPSTPIAWSSLINATASLTLANAGFATTFNQTSAVNWTWANTTAATAVTTVASPALTLNSAYWNGSASALDQWTINVQDFAGTNQPSLLEIIHQTGTSGAAVLSTNALVFQYQLGGGAGTTAYIDFDNANSGWTYTFSDATQAFVRGSIVYSATGVGQFQVNAGVGSPQLLLQGDITTGAAACVKIGNQNSLTGTGNQFLTNAAITWAPPSGSGLFVGNLMQLTINQTAGCTGSYRAFDMRITETSALGASNLFLNCQGGSAGTTQRFTLTSAGTVGLYNSVSTVRNGQPAEYASADLTAQSAAITATNLIASAPQTGVYRVAWSATITTAATTSSVLGGTNGFQVVYTSPTDSVTKTTVSGNSVTSAANTTGTATGGELIIYAKTGTAIQYSFDYTSVGVTAMVYELHITVEAL